LFRKTRKIRGEKQKKRRKKGLAYPQKIQGWGCMWTSEDALAIRNGQLLPFPYRNEAEHHGSSKA
jgi:hypothetical protein